MLGRAKEFARDTERYVPLLGLLLAAAAREFPADVELVADVNAEDRARLSTQWAEFVQDAVPGRAIALGGEPLPCTGGVVLRTPDNRIRVDNSFEGRMKRLDIRIYQTIVERLFPGQADVQSLTIG